MFYQMFAFFFLYCNAHLIHFESDNGLITCDSDISSQDDIDSVEDSIQSMLEQGEILNECFEKLFENPATRSIFDVLDFFQSYLVTIETIYNVLKELTFEESFGPDFTTGICLCSDTKFGSKFQLAEDGFVKLKNLIDLLKKHLSEANSLPSSLSIFLFSKCKPLMKTYRHYGLCLTKYYNHVYSFEVEELIDHLNTEFKIFLQNNFCCLVNTFVKVLETIVLYCTINDLHIQGMGYEENLTQLIYIHDSLHTRNCQNGEIEEHITSKMKIYNLLEKLEITEQTHIFCYGSILNVKLKEHLLKKKVQKTLLDEVLVDEFTQFRLKRGLGSLNMLYHQYLLQQIKIFETLDAKIINADIDDITTNIVILSTSESARNTPKRSQILKLLRFTLRGMCFVQEFVFSSEKTNFNIFLGSAFNRLNFLIEQIGRDNPLESLRNQSYALLQASNHEKRSKILSLMRNDVQKMIKSLYRYKKMIDLLDRGWFKEQQIFSTTDINTRQKIEEEIIEFLSEQVTTNLS